MNTHKVYTIQPNLVNVKQQIKTSELLSLPPKYTNMCIASELINGVMCPINKYMYTFILVIDNITSVEPMVCTLISTNNEWGGILCLEEPLQFNDEYINKAKDDKNNRMSLLMKQL